MAHRFGRNAGKTDLKRLGPGKLWEPRELEVTEGLLGSAARTMGLQLFLSLLSLKCKG